MNPEKLIYKTDTEHHMKALTESVKTYVRTWVLTVAPVALLFIAQGINLETGEIAVNWQVLRATVLYTTIGMFGITPDRYKHILNKSKAPKELEGQSAGILKF
jgi:fatty-acid desaturase